MRIGLQMRRLRMRLGAIENIRHRLTFSGRERRNIYERLYPVVRWASDDGARIRVSRQQYGPAGSLNRALESRDVIRERCEGNRRADYLETFLSQRQNDIAPTGTVSPRAMDQNDRGVRSKRTHCAAPFAARNSFIAAAISTTCVSMAKCPVSRNSTRALGMSFRNASAPAGMKKGSFLPQIASNGGLAFR